VIEYARQYPARAAAMVIGGTVWGLVMFVLVRVLGVFGGLTGDPFDPAIAAEGLAGRSNADVEADRRRLSEEQRRLLDQLAAQGLASFEVEQELLSRINEIQDKGRFVNPDAVSPALPDDMFESYLAIGADASGALADTVILGLVPSDGGTPILVSLPRDLYLQDPCTRGWSRLNTGLGGCRDFASGIELVALMVQTYTGIDVDHTARVNFEGFVQVVDALGGTQVCVDYQTRDIKAGLSIAAGCTQADGQITLAWARARHSEQLVDGVWKQTASSDFARQQRQQDVLFQLAGKVRSFSSLGDFDATLSALSAAVRLDSSWGFADAVATAWRYRSITKDQARILSISVADYRTSAGAQVLIPKTPFNEILSAVYPPAAR
jgi:LCP family protein required for cell wall assembly